MKIFNKLVLCVIISLLAFTANAQERVRPFQKLGVGVEFGTTGVGFEVSTSLHKMVNVRAGFSILPFSYKHTFDIEFDDYNLNQLRQDYGPELMAGYGVNLDLIQNEVRLKAKTDILNGKLLVDFHPFRNSSFHVTAGLFFGRERLITVDGSLPEETWRTINQVNDALRQNPQWNYEPFDLSVKITDDTTIAPDANGHVDAGIRTNAVKPYFGIGFGRAIPKRSWGFQFDLGAMFHGKPEIVSKNPGIAESIYSDRDADDFIKIMKKVTVYPVMTFKVTKKIL